MSKSSRDIRADGDVAVGIAGDVIGSTIQDSFNFVQSSSAPSELKEKLKELHRAVDAAVEEMKAEGKGDPEVAAERLDSFAREAVKKKPLPEVLKATADSIIEAVGAIGAAAAPVAATVRGVLRLVGIPVP